MLTKERQSMLDPYEETLFEMEAQKKTLAEMQQWLVVNQGLTMTPQGISKFLAGKRRDRWQAQLLEKVTGGGRHNGELKAALAENPAPDGETLAQLNRVLIVDLARKASAVPELSKESAVLTRMALQYANSEAWTQLRAREVALQEARAAEAAKSDQLKGLEACLIEAKDHPEVQNMLRQAFALLSEKLEPATANS